jgi:hypothetical protein
MLVRNFETGEPVLTEWTEYRAAIRAESNRIEVISVAATTVVALEAIKNNWPLSPDAIAEEARRAAEVEAAKLENLEADKG